MMFSYPLLNYLYLSLYFWYGTTRTICVDYCDKYLSSRNFKSGSANIVRTSIPFVLLCMTVLFMELSN